ncbi:efflux RND transporter permease subunit [Terriglobus sp. 2YAB30_2]|uniref:efflux RND transporter permease subunit n=3 Tax=unclassified Terriglobus TaxID=2628988 RepID=UPI003F9D5398
MTHEHNEQSTEKKQNLARFFIEQRHVAWVSLAVAIVWGIYGLLNMPQRKDPDIPVRQAMVIVPWQGTSSEQVEQLVTRKIEQALASNQWVTEIKSASRTGSTMVQFELAEKGKYDRDKELDDVKTRLDAIHDLPQGAGPILYIKDFGDTSALMLTVASPSADPAQIEWTSKMVEAQIRSLRNLLPTQSQPRRSIVIAFPKSIDNAEVQRKLSWVAQDLVAQQLCADVRPFSGEGFTGVDLTTNLSSAELQSALRKSADQNLQTDEFHPDAWQPAIIDNPADTAAALQTAAGDKYTYRDLEDFTDTIQRSLKTLPIVSNVERSGVLGENVFLNFSQERLAQYKLTPADLPKVLAARNLPDGGQTLNASGRTVSINTTGEFKSTDDLRNMMIGASPNGTPLYLRDLVDIERGYENPPSFLNRYTRSGKDGKWITTRAITLSVQMRKGEQISSFGKQVDANLESVRKTLPADLILARTSDQPLQVHDSIELFSHSLVEALVLVVIVALIGFWSWRTATLIAVSMPITLAITFGVIHTLGIDLQQVSIASLIIALGLLVDVPVVSGDAIVRELGEGQPRATAAWVGPTKLFKTMAYATVTNIVSYLPFLLLPGDTGKFLYSLPVVISCSLLAALLVSMTFVPLISSFLLQSRSETPIEVRRQRGFTGWYYRTARKAIEHRKLCLAASLILLIAGGVVFSTLKPQFFPKDLQYFSYIDVWLPEDSPASATSEVAQQVESITRQVAEEYGKRHPEHGRAKEVLQSMTTFVGGGGPRFWSSATPEDRQTNYAQVILRTKDNHDTTPLLALLQVELDRRIPGAIIDTRTLETGKPVGIPIQVRISGEDLPRLKLEAAKLKQIFRDVPVAARVRDDWGDSSTREVVHVDVDRANMAHVTNADVSTSIDAALHGVTAGALRDGDKQVPIVGRMQMEQRAQLSDLHSLYVFSQQGTAPVPVDQVATISLEPVVSKTKRFDQYRTITIQCWPTQGHLPSEVLAAAMPKLKEFQKQLPDGFIFRFAGEQKEQVSGFGDLTTVLVICVCAIYLALLAQFKHAFKPLIVFAAIPYGIAGAVIALAIMGQPFGFMAFLGIISLIGVIVSHIIVLFEFIEERREAGEDLEQALIDAGILRLRPVMITVAATVIALFPLAAHGGPLWEPLCYAQIGGLTIATFVTLGLVPVLYSFVVLDLKLIRWEQVQETTSAATSDDVNETPIVSRVQPCS